MPMRGKVAIVTGAARGIGRETALEFARQGANVAVADVLDEAGQETVRLIEQSGGEALFVHCDVAQPEQIENLVRCTVKAFSAVDYLDNNAGIVYTATLTETPPEEWERVLNINLSSIYNASRYCIAEMQKRCAGAFVTIASVHAFSTMPRFAAYAAAKGAIPALTRSMAIDYAKDNIRVNAVAPGAIDTPMLQNSLKDLPNPQAEIEKILQSQVLKRLGRPIDIANMVVYLCSDRADFITGNTFLVDGGLLSMLTPNT